MKVFGLIGFPLSHSFSQSYFTEKFEKENIKDVSYRVFPLENIENFPEIISTNPDLRGINVTIPHKENVIRYLDFVEKTAGDVGAVNTIKVVRNNDITRLEGYNTDVYGFRRSLEPLLTGKYDKALILGAGGAAKAVKYVLKQLKIECISASIEELKEDEIGYNDITPDMMRSHLIIINATPLGMYPDTGSYPDIPYDLLTEDHILYDLVYNPEETAFLGFGVQANTKTINGLSMLHLQAEKSWEIWNAQN